MLIKPFKGDYAQTQGFNDKCCRASYAKFGLSGHNGWDFGTPFGTELLAPHNGRVTESVFDATGYGWYIKIENDAEWSILAHMVAQSPVAIGAEVKQGDVVGKSGNTGNSSGPHCHWGYGRNPRNRDNGFNGYLDQTHWMDVTGDCSEVELELDEMRISRNEWRDKAKKALAEGKPLTAYTVLELFNALGVAIKEMRWK